MVERPTYYSTNTVMSEGEEQFQYPAEFLQHQNLSSIPPHELILKNNVPIMLLRNINPPQRLTNGTRLKVTKMGERVIEAKILGG